MKKLVLKTLFFLFLNKIIIFFLNKRFFIKFLYYLNLIFSYIFVLNDIIISFFNLRTKHFKIKIRFIDSKKVIKFINKFAENDFIRLFLLNLFKVFLKIIKIILNFLGFIIYAIWSYLNTILLYAIGYILLEFGATRIYDPNQDITSREIWEIISKKLNVLKKKYLSKRNIILVFNVLLKKLKIKFLEVYDYKNNLFIIIYYKLFYVFENVIFNFYIYFIVLILTFLINNILFFKKIFYFKGLKKKLTSFLKNFKMYINFNYLKFFINLFKKKKLFFLNKNFFKREKLLNLFNYKIYIFNFKMYLKTKNKLKYKMLYVKNVFQFTRFKYYFCYRIKFWSTQKRFLYFYLKLLRKSKKIKMGALRVIYIEEWWVYKFYLKNYYFSTILKMVSIVYNLIKFKIIFVILYLNFFVDIMFF